MHIAFLCALHLCTLHMPVTKYINPFSGYHFVNYRHYPQPLFLLLGENHCLVGFFRGGYQFCGRTHLNGGAALFPLALFTFLPLPVRPSLY